MLPLQFTTEALWSVLSLIPVSRGEGSDPHSYHQTTKATLGKGFPVRSGYMHIEKQVTLSILAMLVPREVQRQPKTRVCSLLIDPNAMYQNTQMTVVPQGSVMLTFYSSLPL